MMDIQILVCPSCRFQPHWPWQAAWRKQTECTFQGPSAMSSWYISSSCEVVRLRKQTFLPCLLSPETSFTRPKKTRRKCAVGGGGLESQWGQIMNTHIHTQVHLKKYSKRFSGLVKQADNLKTLFNAILINPSEIWLLSPVSNKIG